MPKQSSNKQPKAEQNLRGGHLTKRRRRLKVAPLWLLLSFEILFYSLLLMLLLLLILLLNLLMLMLLVLLPLVLLLMLLRARHRRSAQICGS